MFLYINGNMKYDNRRGENMTKKISMWLIALFMITTIVGCQKKEESTPSAPKEEVTTGKKIEKSSNGVSVEVQK